MMSEIGDSWQTLPRVVAGIWKVDSYNGVCYASNHWILKVLAYPRRQDDGPY